MDLTREIEGLAAPGRRAPGSEAERQAAREVEKRLRGLGRAADMEIAFCWPGWPLTYALHGAVAVIGSVISVSAPGAGGALVLAALVLTFLDTTGMLLTTRRLFGRRATQNVVSREDASERPRGAPVQAAKPGTLVLVAHCDSPRGGIAFGRRWRIPGMVWAMAAVCVCYVLRTALDLDGTSITAVQFVPTVILIACAGSFVDTTLARPALADDAGPALALALGARHGGRLRSFDLWVLVTGAQSTGAHGMRTFLCRHDAELPRERTILVNLDGADDPRPRFTRREGTLLTVRSHPRLVDICREIAEDTGEPTPRAFVDRGRGDGAAASAAGYPAITIAGAARAEAFCDELIRRVDAGGLSGSAP
jgi:hypothetical protein